MYRCKAFKRPSKGATGEGEAARPTRPDAFLLDYGSECLLPAMRDSRLVVFATVTGTPDFTGRWRRAPRSMAWAGFRRRHVRARREHRFNTSFDCDIVCAYATCLAVPILAVNGHALPSPQTAPLERLLRCEHRVSMRTTHGRSALLAYSHPTGDGPLKRSALVGSGGTSPPISVCPSTLLLPHRLL